MNYLFTKKQKTYWPRGSLCAFVKIMNYVEIKIPDREWFLTQVVKSKISHLAVQGLNLNVCALAPILNLTPNQGYITPILNLTPT